MALQRGPYMMVFTIVLIVLSRKYVDSSNSDHVLGVRILYVISQVLSFAIIGYLYILAKNNKEQGLVSVKVQDSFAMVPDEAERKEEKISVSQYDMKECTKQFYRALVGVAVTCGIHLYWGFVPPLILQAFAQPIGLFNSPLVKISLRGFRAWGELKRPWTDPTEAATGQWSQLAETWTAAMTGAPVVRRNVHKEKKTKKRR